MRQQKEEWKRQVDVMRRVTLVVSGAHYDRSPLVTFRCPVCGIYGSGEVDLRDLQCVKVSCKQCSGNPGFEVFASMLQHVAQHERVEDGLLAFKESLCRPQIAGGKAPVQNGHEVKSGHLSGPAEDAH